MDGKKAWDNRGVFSEDKTYKIVFTTDYKDILGMSSRSQWTSCQDIRPTKKIKNQDINFAKQLLGACVSKNVGIIYLTDEEDFEGRGEKMLYRCAVWLVRKIEDDTEELVLQAMYPTQIPGLTKLFADLLSKHTLMTVADYSGKKPVYFSAHYINDEPELEEQKLPKPYDDAELLTTSFTNIKNIIFEKTRLQVNVPWVLRSLERNCPNEENLEEAANKIVESMNNSLKEFLRIGFDFYIKNYKKEFISILKDYTNSLDVAKDVVRSLVFFSHGILGETLSHYMLYNAIEYAGNKYKKALYDIFDIMRQEKIGEFITLTNPIY